MKLYADEPGAGDVREHPLLLVISAEVEVSLFLCFDDELRVATARDGLAVGSPG